jgi:hypothetical protein
MPRMNVRHGIERSAEFVLRYGGLPGLVAPHSK